MGTFEAMEKIMETVVKPRLPEMRELAQQAWKHMQAEQEHGRLRKEKEKKMQGTRLCEFLQVHGTLC